MKRNTLITIIGASIYMLSCGVLVVLTEASFVGKEMSSITTGFIIGFASGKLASWVYNKLKD